MIEEWVCINFVTVVCSLKYILSWTVGELVHIQNIIIRVFSIAKKRNWICYTIENYAFPWYSSDCTSLTSHFVLELFLCAGISHNYPSLDVYYVYRFCRRSPNTVLRMHCQHCTYHKQLLSLVVWLCDNFWLKILMLRC